MSVFVLFLIQTPKTAISVKKLTDFQL